MPDRRRSTPIQRLLAAMDRCAIARGEAQWTNGYRAGVAKPNPGEEQRLYPKEMRQWEAVGAAERAFKRLAQRVIRESRRRK